MFISHPFPSRSVNSESGPFTLSTLYVIQGYKLYKWMGQTLTAEFSGSSVTVHPSYLLALKRATKHCDFMSNIKIFRFIPVTDTITDAEISVCVICSSCDFPVVLHLLVIYSMAECVWGTLRSGKFTFTLFWKVLSDLMKYKCRSELVLSFICLLHWQGVFAWLYRS